jgi:gliding motility-associated protein GldC
LNLKYWKNDPGGEQKEPMKTSEINFKVTVDENHLPVKIEWEAPDSGEKSEAKSVMISLWVTKENNTLRIDLWTKDMTVDEMKKFFHQNIMTLTDTYVRATNDNNTADQVKKFFQQIGKDIGVLK